MKPLRCFKDLLFRVKRFKKKISFFALLACKHCAQSMQPLQCSYPFLFQVTCCARGACEHLLFNMQLYSLGVCHP